MKLIQKDNGRMVALFAIVAIFAIITTAFVVTESDGVLGDRLVTSEIEDQYVDAWSNATFTVGVISTNGSLRYTGFINFQMEEDG